MLISSHLSIMITQRVYKSIGEPPIICSRMRDTYTSYEYNAAELVARFKDNTQRGIQTGDTTRHNPLLSSIKYCDVIHVEGAKKMMNNHRAALMILMKFNVKLCLFTAIALVTKNTFTARRKYPSNLPKSGFS